MGGPFVVRLAGTTTAFLSLRRGAGRGKGLSSPAAAAAPPPSPAAAVRSRGGWLRSGAMTASGPPIRLLPRLDELNRFFWTSGGDGRLRFQRCGACAKLVHPPGPRCPYCLEPGTLAPSEVSGRA